MPTPGSCWKSWLNFAGVESLLSYGASDSLGLKEERLQAKDRGGWPSFPQGLQESGTLGSTTDTSRGLPPSSALGTCSQEDSLSARVPRLYLSLRGGSRQQNCGVFPMRSQNS